jgi:hypothetical protein
MSSAALEKLFIAELNTSDASLKPDLFSYESIFLDRIRPDPSNARFLPATFISNNDAASFTRRLLTKADLMAKYPSVDRVLVGKGCFIICMPYGSQDWKNASESIESIIDLAEHVKSSELIQAPTIFPLEEGNYQILTGHRRFLAMIYAEGLESAAQFKVYKRQPLLQKTKQFQENASRQDLPQYGKLNAFASAKKELDVLSNARLKLGGSRLTVRELAERMGISMGAYDNYNVLTRYPCVPIAYEEGMRTSFTKVKKIVLDIESAFIAEHEIDKLNASDKKLIDEKIQLALLGNDPKPAKKPTIKFAEINSAETVKTLLANNIFEMDTGIDWSAVDWDDAKCVSEAIILVIEYLESSA